MANNEINVRLIINNKTKTQWLQTSYVPLKGELCIEIDTRMMKVGDGLNAYSNLDYMYLSVADVQRLIDSAEYTLPIASSSQLGGVKIGTNINVNSSDGTIQISDASTNAKGVVQLNDAINSTSTVTAATANAVKQAYDRGSQGVTDAATALARADSKIGQIVISEGNANGQIQYTVDEGNAVSVSVHGLGSAAFTESSIYATSAQGTKADNAMPKSGGTFTGNVSMDTGKTFTLQADPTSDFHAATKKYVDAQIVSKLQTSDAMTFRGTIGTNGTFTNLPTTNVVKGDTYKVITAGTYAGQVCKIGDLIIAANNSVAGTEYASNSTNWIYVPSGDEAITTISVNTDNVNVDSTAKTGAITLGMAAAKQVDTTVSSGTQSTNLPTSQAVVAFVEGKGYLTQDTKVRQTLISNTDTNNRPLLMAYSNNSATTANVDNISYRANSIYANAQTGTITASGFKGNLTGDVTGNVSGSSGSCTGNSATASKLLSSASIGISGKATATAATFDGSSNVNIEFKTVSTDAFTQGSDTLILNGTVSTS